MLTRRVNVTVSEDIVLDLDFGRIWINHYDPPSTVPEVPSIVAFSSRDGHMIQRMYISALAPVVFTSISDFKIIHPQWNSSDVLFIIADSIGDRVITQYQNGTQGGSILMPGYSPLAIHIDSKTGRTYVSVQNITTFRAAILVYDSEGKKLLHTLVVPQGWETLPINIFADVTMDQ